MTDPVLTRAEQEVADGLAKGWSYQQIAAWLGVKRATVYVLAGRIAAKLDNPNELKPYQLVFQWALRRGNVKKTA